MWFSRIWECRDDRSVARAAPFPAALQTPPISQHAYLRSRNWGGGVIVMPRGSCDLRPLLTSFKSALCRIQLSFLLKLCGNALQPDDLWTSFLPSPFSSYKLSIKTSYINAPPPEFVNSNFCPFCVTDSPFLRSSPRCSQMHTAHLQVLRHRGQQECSQGGGEQHVAKAGGRKVAGPPGHVRGRDERVIGGGPREGADGGGEPQVQVPGSTTDACQPSTRQIDIGNSAVFW